MILSSLLIFSGILALLAVFSVIFSNISLILKLTCLILTFFLIACEYIILDFNFLGLSFIIVYVGAISILFLFVIMMTDNGITPQFIINRPYSYTILLISFILMTPLLYYLIDFSINQIFQIYMTNFYDNIAQIDSIEIFGRMTYISFPIINILFAILLWCILIGILRITGL